MEWAPPAEPIRTGMLRILKRFGKIALLNLAFGARRLVKMLPRGLHETTGQQQGAPSQGVASTGTEIGAIGRLSVVSVAPPHRTVCMATASSFAVPSSSLVLVLTLKRG
jgi:hypothetical protein